MALCLAEYVSFQTRRESEDLVRSWLRDVFWVFLGSFATSIYLFLQNRVLPICMKMVE